MECRFLNKRLNQITNEIETLEKDLKILLPPRLKTFFSKFQLGPDTLNYIRVFRQDIEYFDIVGPIGFIDKQKNDEIFIDHFLDINEIKFNWFEHDQSDETGMRNLMKIAELSSDPNGGLYIGIGKKNSNQIWVVNWDRGENRFIKVFEGIDELLLELKQFEN